MSNYCVQKLIVQGPEEYLFSFIMKGGNRLATVLGASSGFSVREDHVFYDFKTKAHPPLETDGTSPTSAILQQVARKYPNLTFLVEFLYEGYYEGGQMRYRGQEVVVTDYFTSWFRTAKPGEPVHHRTAIFDPQNNYVGKLIVDRILFRSETAVGKNAYAFRVPVEDLPVSPKHVLAYTLDETDYLEQCVMGIGNALWGGEVRNMSLRLCDCPITLTQAELEWLATVRLDDVEREKVRRITRFIYSEFSNSQPTNRRELSLLLAMPTISDERHSEIHDAMMKPNWIESWPAWDELTKVDWQSSGDDTFLAELEDLTK